MAVRGGESILWTRNGVQFCGRGKRRRSRELLVVSPHASSRCSSMVGLAGAEVEKCEIRRSTAKKRIQTTCLACP